MPLFLGNVLRAVDFNLKIILRLRSALKGQTSLFDPGEKSKYDFVYCKKWTQTCTAVSMYRTTRKRFILNGTLHARCPLISGKRA